jgi:peptide/nickel transport system ATP-binding protein
MSEPILTISGLVTRFKDRKTGEEIRACDGIDLTLEKGEIVGLVGESGCGKSTLGRTIVGLEQPSAGSIVYNGVDLLGLGAAARRKARSSIQYIFQDPYSSLSTRQTVGQAIDEALIINGERNAAARKARVDELLGLVGLPTHVYSRYARELSGGQRQRICIARTLAANPSVLICDEPVSSLDVSIRAQVMNLFLKLRDDLGMACLLIAHDLAIVRQAASRVYVMYLGKIMEAGGSEGVYGKPSHPYTQSLMSAVPDPNPIVERSRQRILLRGDVPSPVNPPSGCRFRTRCPAAESVCSTPPPAERMSIDHFAVCHFAGRVRLVAGSPELRELQR